MPVIKSLYGKYFQKSKSFLYPALGIKKNSKFSPSGTYMAIEGYIGAEDVKFICTFERINSDEYKTFEQNMLLENPLFLEKIDIEEYTIYIYDYTIYQNDWFNFILGKYSKLSQVLKRAIKNYYGDNSSEYKYMDSYLHPQEYYDDYSSLLNVTVEDLKYTGELCDACDIEKETLKIPKEYLEKLKKTI
jgi:hypothetical protein